MLQYPDPRGADFSLVERFDNFAAMRNGLRRVARQKDEWAGIPMPISGMPIVIEPTYPRGEELAKIGQAEKPEPEPVPEADRVEIRNTWWSAKLQCEVWVYTTADGRSHVMRVPGRRRLDLEVTTLGASAAWGIEQEANAVHTLGELLHHHAFKQYLLTGMFLETSKRSRLTYLFRKLRPTVVLDGRLSASEPDKPARVLATLCLHPIAYYEGSWAGAMCPTDDVIAHLMLMRGDEAMFWRRANQGQPGQPGSGI